MRKIALVLVASMMLTAAACGKKEAAQPKEDTTKTEIEVGDETEDNNDSKDDTKAEDTIENKDDTKVEDNTENKDDNNTDNNTDNKTDNKTEDKADSSSETKNEGSVAQALLKDFKSKVRDKKDPQKLADMLITNKVIKFQPATMEVEPGPLNGFSADIKGFKKGVMFSPMIGTIPFVGYIFTVADGEDVDKFVENLEKNANQRWNICTEADEMVVTSVGNTVFFVMSPTKFEE